MTQLSPRQQLILESVIEQHVATGRPVGSRVLFDSGGFGLAPSSLRGELARLEQLGYLDHPHTSAGRVPTDKGYRFYVDNNVRGKSGGRSASVPGSGVVSERQRRLEGELEDALRDATSVLARTTGLMALVTAPADGSQIRHVEVLQLHPDLIMVVLITASGGVSKKVIEFGEAVDTGLVDWSRGFLNDALFGLELGSRRLRMRLNDPGLTPAETTFIGRLAPAFSAASAAELYMKGVTRLITRMEESGSVNVRSLAEILDRQDEILVLLGEALSESSIYLRIGRELSRTAMDECSLVAANYGVAHRNLGTVGVLGPRRMDYPKVISSVRSAAWSLNRFLEEIYQ